jgi:branched-chain amino acid transport system substrate-binding protein
MSMPNRGRHALASAVAVSGLVMLMTACGSRVSLEEITTAEGALPATSLGGSANAATTADTAGTGAVAAPGAVVPAGTSTTGTTPATAAPGTAVAPGTDTTGSGAIDTPAVSGAGSAAVPVAAGCAKVLSPVRIGQVGTFSGVIGQALGASKTGMQLWAKDVNARGGVACHPVQLFQVDDQSDPSKSAAAALDLYNNKKVIAFVGSFVPLSISGYAQSVERLKAITIGGDAASQTPWNTSPLFFPQGASVNATFFGAIHEGAKEGGNKLAMVYCVEAANICPAAKKYIVDDGGAQAAGAQVVYSANASLTQADFTSLCQNAKNAGATQVFLAMDGSSIIRFANSCERIGYRPLLSTNAIATGFDPIQPVIGKFGLWVGGAAMPWTVNDTPASKRFQTALATYAAGTPSVGAMSNGFSCGLLFEKAIENVAAEAKTGDITTALVLKGLGKIKNETLGGAVAPLTFTPNQAHAPLQLCYFVAKLVPTGWTAPLGSKTQCAKSTA